MNLILDTLVPFGAYLRRAEHRPPFSHLLDLFLHVIPLTFFVYWLFSFIPFVGSLLYILILVPLSARQHILNQKITKPVAKKAIVLWYLVVVSIGFVGLWNFIGHTLLADQVATLIGWATGSPFQTELAFFALGVGVAGLMAIWLKGHMITALVVTKSIFLYGAGFVHLKEAFIHQNYSPLNIGAPLIGDLVFPTVLLTLLFLILKTEAPSFSGKALL